MRKSTLVSAAMVLATIVFSSQSFSQANVQLSNLSAPTGVNVNLLPNSTGTKDLGSLAFNWNNFYFSGSVFKGSTLFMSTTGEGNVTLGLDALKNNTLGNLNTAIGDSALFSNDVGSANTAIGAWSMYSNIKGIWNTASGFASLYSNTDGSDNTAFGYSAMRRNERGFQNTGIGSLALNNNINGIHNTATGTRSLFRNISGSENAAFGNAALRENRTGNYNTAVGVESAASNNTGTYNTSVGYLSSSSNIDGQKNTAVGAFSLVKSKGSNNASVGVQSLLNNTTGSQNTAVGVDALFGTTTQNRNTGVGYMAGLNSATQGTFLGANSNATAGLTNVTAIGYGAFATSSNQVRIGSVNVTSIGGNVNWTNFSDGRYKKDVKEDVPGLDFINELKAVTYTLDVDRISKATKSLAPGAKDEAAEDNSKQSKIVYTGFVAQDVEKAAKKMNYSFSGVDVPESENGFYGLRYSDFVVPLTKAVQELSAKNEALEKELQELREIVRRLDGRAGAVSKATLGQNYPNPFSARTVVQFNVPSDSRDAKIVVTNIKGQQLQAFNVGKDMSQVTINAGTLPAGAYQYSLYINGEKVETRKMIIAR